MNRSSFILGMALLVVAITLAVTITVRNAPRDAGEVVEAGSTEKNSSGNRAFRAGDSADFDRPSRLTPRASRGIDERVSYRVQLPSEQSALLPVDERAELTDRAARVEGKARAQLERMTEEFELTGEQRRKMFPMLVRSTAGFDPRMQVGGVYLESDPKTLPDEEMHDVLDSEQRDQLVDEEIKRQLWWQEIFARLEKELIDSTGGAPTEETVPSSGDGEAPPPADDERTTPAPRTGGSLGNLLGQ